MSVNIPSPMSIDLDIDGGLDLGVDINRLPKIEIGLDPLEIKPLDISLRLKEIPSIRLHLPADFKMGFALFGAELLTVRLCGKAQAITEDYVPNPCERYDSFSRDSQERHIFNRIDITDDTLAEGRATGGQAHG